MFCSRFTQSSAVYIDQVISIWAGDIDGDSYSDILATVVGSNQGLYFGQHDRATGGTPAWQFSRWSSSQSTYGGPQSLHLGTLLELAMCGSRASGSLLPVVLSVKYYYYQSELRASECFQHSDCFV